ncbi:MAG: CHAD domain-containing protein [candidate division FCPU426 bacterium]
MSGKAALWGREPAAFRLEGKEDWSLICRKELARQTWRLWQQAQVAAGGSRDGIRDLRVALHRIGLLLRTGGPWAWAGSPDECLHTLREFADLAAPIREWDVLTQRFAELLQHGHQPTPAGEALLAKMSSHREDLLARVLPDLQSARFRKLVVDLLCQAEAGSGRKTLPAAAKAARLLRKLAKKTAKKSARPITGMAPRELHHLRIACGRLRDACEFYAPLFSKKIKKSSRAWKEMQDRLGACQDGVSHIALLENLVATADRFQTNVEEGLLVMVMIRHLQEGVRLGRLDCERRRARFLRRLQRFRRSLAK